MTVLSVKAQSLLDAKKGKPLFSDDDLIGMELVEVSNLSVGILEGGTENGQVSLSFLTKNKKDGIVTVVQMTANQFTMLVSAYNGAIQRFLDEKAKNN